MWIAKIGCIVLSIVLISLGILYIVLPGTSMQAIGKMLGITMILFGSIKLVGYFSKDLFRLAFQYDLQFGILFCAIGIIVLLKPSEVINLIFTAMGTALFTDSLFKVQIAFDSQKFGIRKWWGILVLAVLTGISSLVLVLKPSENTGILTLLLSTALIAEGILNLYVAITTVKIVKHQFPDSIEDDCFETEEENI